MRAPVVSILLFAIDTLLDKGVHRRHQQRLQGPIAGGLLLLQLSLLTFLGFHYHYDADLAGSAPASVQAAPSSAAPAATDWVLCPVCQIMRSGAARPAIASVSPKAVTYSFFALGRAPVYGLRLRPATIHGRAPPLS
jgi:hypothetical protein